MAKYKAEIKEIVYFSVEFEIHSADEQDIREAAYETLNNGGNELESYTDETEMVSYEKID
jgi:hypothetical protein